MWYDHRLSSTGHLTRNTSKGTEDKQAEILQINNRFGSRHAEANVERALSGKTNSSLSQISCFLFWRPVLKAVS